MDIKKTLAHPKVLLGLVLGGLGVLFVVQNTAVVEVRFLFWTLAMSRALLILLALGFGAAIGWVVRSLLDGSRGGPLQPRGKLPSGPPQDGGMANG